MLKSSDLIFAFSLVASSVSCNLAQAHLVEKTVEYKIISKDVEKTFEGFIVYDSAAKKVPGVLVVHDWLGLTEKTKNSARELAKLGYVAFAGDIYGKGVRPNNPKDAATEATKYKTNRELYREYLNAGLEQLKQFSQVDTSRLGAIGYCFGGTGVVELARSGAAVKGIVSFHGGLDSPQPESGKNIKARVLALHGADDPFVSATDLAAFEKEMATNKVDWQLIKYGNAVHSFTDKSAGTDNSKGAAYNEKAAKRSWAAMKEFLSETL